MRRYDLAKSLFLQALDQPPGQREPFVAKATAGDDELRREVEELLAFHDGTQGVIDEMPAHDDHPERVGPWRIEGELGRGGIGVVYLARRGNEPPVALKVLRGGLLSPQLVARFRREALVLARLDHPGIARSIETGIDEGPRGPRPWLAMERIEGTDLRAWAAGAHGQNERLELMARVCDAVEHAHAHGVVHRDLKPENILVRPDGQPVVLDFGVARLVDSDVRATTLLTTVGVLVGTIRYMSPEQADAAPDGIGPRSDVHQLAALTYEMVTGRLPFDVPENSIHRALVAVLTAPPRPMEELPPKLRRPLERVLRAALAKDPARRLASAALLAADLRRIAAGRPPLARPPREGGLDWAAAGRAALGLGAAAAAVAWLLGGIGAPPSPLDRAVGAAAPARMYRRVMREADSALVRLHYNTRTLARLREARVHAERALALESTLAGQPWFRHLRAYLRFRLGEAEYLIAERTYDAALYAKAADTWYASRLVPQPAGPMALPDTSGVSARRALEPIRAEAWGAAAMALDDLARISDPQGSHERALAIRREGVEMFVPELGGRPLLEAPMPEARDARQSMAGWLQGMGASLSRLGFDRGDAASVQEGVRYLRRAAAVREIWDEGAGYASVLHDLGTAFLWAALLARDGALLDSALVRLGSATEIRADLPGYTSVVQSSRELARAHRLAAWRAPDPAAQRRHLALALGVLAPRASEDVPLGAPDRALLALGRAEVLVDMACVERDSSLLRRAAGELDQAESALPRQRAPVLAAQADVQRIRIEGQWYAITGARSQVTRARQVIDRINMDSRGTTNRMLALVSASATAFSAGPPRRFDLRYPVPEPF